MTTGQSDDYKLIIVVRQDIRLSPGKMAAQVAHAAVSCALRSKKKHRRVFSAWISQGQRKVVLRGSDLAELRELRAEADAAGLLTEMIQDAGLTEVPPGTITCLGIGPGSDEELDRITGHLKLA